VAVPGEDPDEIRRPKSGDGQGGAIRENQRNVGFVSQVDAVDERIAVLPDGLVHPGPVFPVVIRNPPVALFNLEAGCRPVLSIRSGIDDNHPALGEVEKPAHLLTVFHKGGDGEQVIVFLQGGDDNLQGGKVGIQLVHSIPERDKGRPGGKLKHRSVRQGDEDIIGVGGIHAPEGNATGGGWRHFRPTGPVVDGNGPAPFFRLEQGGITISHRYFYAGSIPEPRSVEGPIELAVSILPDADGRSGSTVHSRRPEECAAPVAERKGISVCNSVFDVFGYGRYISSSLELAQDGLQGCDILVDPFHGGLQGLDFLLVFGQLLPDCLQFPVPVPTGRGAEDQAEAKQEGMKKTTRHQAESSNGKDTLFG